MLARRDELIDHLPLAPHALGAGPLGAALDQHLQAPELDVARGKARCLGLPLLLEAVKFGLQALGPPVQATQVGDQPSVAVGERVSGAPLLLGRRAQSGELVAERGDRLVGDEEAVTLLVPRLADKAGEHCERVHRGAAA
jgi:hypothetical protein